MEDYLVHEIELYSPDSFQTLLEHEVHRSRRYKHPITLIHILVQADPINAQTQHSAEVFAINILNLEVRETDIPCRKGNEFLLLLPFTDEHGARIVCERLEKLFRISHQTYDRVSFQVSAFIGLTSASGDPPLSGNKLIQQASQALQYAQSHHSPSAVLFSEIT